MSDNMYNTYRQRNNSTGVRKHIQKGKYISYQAYISINNKQINLGYFDTKEKAIAARKFAERKSCMKGVHLEDVTPELEEKAFEEIRNNK